MTGAVGPPSQRPGAARLLCRAAALVIGAVGAFGVFVHATVRDATPPLAAVHYALPLVVCAALLAVSSLAWALGGGSRRRSAALAALALILAGSWALGSYETNPCSIADRGTRVLLWNVSRGRSDWDAVAAAAAAHQADLVALVEADRGGKAERSAWRRHFPDHRLLMPGGGLALLTKGSVSATAFRRLRGISSAASIRLALDHEVEPLDIVIVDLDASPRFDKKALIGDAFAPGAPDGTVEIILGDFNAPASSRWFDSVRTRYEHAFEAAGKGWAFTWPRSAPLLALDHVWLSRERTARCTRIFWSELSDHAQVVVDLAPAS